MAADVPTYDGSITLNVRRLLQERRYESLNILLDKYQKQFEQNSLLEERLFSAYAAFDVVDGGYVSLLDAWVNQTPDIYQPYLARANYYYNKGWHERGENWISETEKQQLSLMKVSFKKAMKDAEIAENLNSESIMPFHIMSSIAHIEGKEGLAENYIKRALSRNPLPFKLRAHYVNFLAPRWGGSFKQMQIFIKESLVYSSRNPSLQLLKGYPFIEAARMQKRKGMHKVADKLFSKALAFGDNHVAFNERGKNRYKQEKYKEALEDFDRAIALNHEQADYYYQRSKALAKLDFLSRAVTDIKQAKKLDPNDEYVQSHQTRLATKFSKKGYEFGKVEDYARAVEQFDIALRLDPDNGDLYLRKGRALAKQNKLALAEDNLKTSIHLAPDEFSAYHWLDWVLAKNQQWDKIIKHWSSFIDRNPEISAAYLERSGGYYHKGDMKSAMADLKISADMGNLSAKETYQRFKRYDR